MVIGVERICCKMKDAIAIITARGGSKRIPRKNIKDFCGHPIIHYSIEAALKSGLFSHVMVSTEDEEIAEISRKCGAEIPFMRSEQTSDDYATTADVLLEVLDNYKKMGIAPKYACCIYPTAPFVSPEKLKEAYDMLEKDADIDTVFTVCKFSFPPQRGLFYRGGRMEPVSDEDLLKRSQDLESIYHDCGQFYFFRTDSFIKTRVLERNSAPVIMDELEVQDIDNETDWKLAELKFRILQGERNEKKSC